MSVSRIPNVDHTGSNNSVHDINFKEHETVAEIFTDLKIPSVDFSVDYQFFSDDFIHYTGT